MCSSNFYLTLIRMNIIITDSNYVNVKSKRWQAALKSSEHLQSSVRVLWQQPSPNVTEKLHKSLSWDIILQFLECKSTGNVCLCFAKPIKPSDVRFTIKHLLTWSFLKLLVFSNVFKWKLRLQHKLKKDEWNTEQSKAKTCRQLPCNLSPFCFLEHHMERALFPHHNNICILFSIIES